MRTAAATTICCLFLNVGLAQENQTTPTLEPTPLESFAGRPTANVIWSKEIGGLESEKARATITALIVEDKTSDPSVMRGVRVDLAHIGTPPDCDWKYLAWTIMCRRANAAVFVEEARLQAVRNGIARGAAELRHMEFISQYRATWPGGTSTGLIVCGYDFLNREPEELAALFTEAIAEIKAAPR